MNDTNIYMAIYDALRAHFGYRGWWPADTPFEVVVGAVLTQNTSWNNVEKAIGNLRRADCLTPAKIVSIREQELQERVRAAGYYRQKTKRLKRIAGWIHETCGDDVQLQALLGCGRDSLRAELLKLKGIGPETADSILLYALKQAVFVVDAYTARTLGRHGLISAQCGYEGIQAELEANLADDADLFGDFHAQFVELGKRYCRKRRASCSECPLRPLLGPGEGDLF